MQIGLCVSAIFLPAAKCRTSAYTQKMVKNDTFSTIPIDSRTLKAPAHSAWIRALAPSLESLKKLLEDVEREDRTEARK